MSEKNSWESLKRSADLYEKGAVSKRARGKIENRLEITARKKIRRRKKKKNKKKKKKKKKQKKKTQVDHWKLQTGKGVFGGRDSEGGLRESFAGRGRKEIVILSIRLYVITKLNLIACSKKLRRGSSPKKPPMWELGRSKT